MTCKYCGAIDHHPSEYCPHTFRDYNGEQVSSREYIERLKYRQTHYRQYLDEGGGWRTDIDCFVCFNGHIQYAKRIIVGPCKVCGSLWMNRIRHGVLEDLGGRQLVHPPALVQIIGSNIRFHRVLEGVNARPRWEGISPDLREPPAPPPPVSKNGKPLGRPPKPKPPLDHVRGKPGHIRPDTRYTSNGVKRNSKWNTGRKRSPRAGVPRWQYIECMNEIEQKKKKKKKKKEKK